MLPKSNILWLRVKLGKVATKIKNKIFIISKSLYTLQEKKLNYGDLMSFHQNNRNITCNSITLFFIHKRLFVSKLYAKLTICWSRVNCHVELLLSRRYEMNLRRHGTKIVYPCYFHFELLIYIMIAQRLLD